MKLDSSNVLTAISTVYGTFMSLVTESQVYQIIIAILTILGLTFNIAYTIWKWYRKASKDGKITPDEVDELMDDLHNIKKDGDK